MTPTEAESHARSKKFRADIARKAAELNCPKPTLGAMLPPIPNEDFAKAAEIAFPSFVGSVRRIQRAVLAEYPEISLNDLISGRRHQPLAKVRHIAIYLCCKRTKLSLNKIGQYFERDHSSIHHGAGKIARERAADPALDELISRIEQSLGDTSDA